MPGSSKQLRHSIFRATSLIERFDKVRVNFTDGTADGETRRSILRGRFYFDCKCAICRSDPVGDHQDADKPSRPRNPFSLAAYKRLKAEFKEAWKHKAKEEVEWIPLYHAMKKHFLPEDPIFRMVIIGAIGKALQCGEKKLAFDLTKICLPVLKAVLPEFNEVTGIVYLQGANLAINLDHFDTALEYLTEAKRILLVTHGPSHPVVGGFVEGLLSQWRARIVLK